MNVARDCKRPPDCVKSSERRSRCWENEPGFCPMSCCKGGKADWSRNLSKGRGEEMENVFHWRAGRFCSCFSTHWLTYITLSIFLTLTDLQSCQILDFLILFKRSKKKKSNQLSMYQLQNLLPHLLQKGQTKYEPETAQQRRKAF